MEYEKPKAIDVDEPLEINYISKLFIQTFKHSQGMSHVQKRIMEYLKRVHPNWTITDAILVKIKDRASDPIWSIVGDNRKPNKIPHNMQDESRFTNQLVYQLGELQRVFNSKDEDTETEEELIELLARDIISRDIHYLGHGRPERKPEREHTSLHDSYFSFAKHFAIDGNSTGFKELDLMYKGIEEQTISNLKVQEEFEILNRLYEKKHS